MNLQDLPLLIVALIVFAGVFAFVWMLDSRARRMERELHEELDAENGDDGQRHR